MHLAVAGASLAPGLLVALVAGLVSGADAVGAVLTGALLVAGVVLLGSVAVDVVSGLLPGASLMIAMLTYGLQLMVVLAVLLALETSPAYADLADRRWLFAGLVSVLLAWMAGQVVAAVRVRIPAYDLGATSPGTGGTK